MATSSASLAQEPGPAFSSGPSSNCTVAVSSPGIASRPPTVGSNKQNGLKIGMGPLNLLFSGALISSCIPTTRGPNFGEPNPWCNLVGTFSGFYKYPKWGVPPSDNPYEPWTDYFPKRTSRYLWNIWDSEFPCPRSWALRRCSLDRSQCRVRHRLHHTVDGRNPAPPKKPWNRDSPVNTNKQLFPMVSIWCRISSIHSMVTVDGTIPFLLASELEQAAPCAFPRLARIASLLLVW